MTTKEKKLIRKFANAVMRYCTHDDQDKYGSIEYLSETIVPLAEKILNSTKE